jgi:hypothetical protein
MVAVVVAPPVVAVAVAVAVAVVEAEAVVVIVTVAVVEAATPPTAAARFYSLSPAGTASLIGRTTLRSSFPGTGLYSGTTNVRMYAHAHCE